MGGSGGFFNWGRGSIRDRVDHANQDAEASGFGTQVAELFSDYLKNFNDRDVAQVRERLDQIKELIADHTDEALEQNFGGSVAKHTYVEGLSDIDALLILNNTQVECDPETAKATIADALGQRLPGGCEVRTGELAVTVTYPDGQEIQLLPAVRKDDGGLRIQSATRPNAWSHINPAGFQKALTKTNQECGGKLIPTIKLVKAINGALPEGQQLSGYHIESLAISAFRSYAGTCSTTAMVKEFFRQAPDLVRQPIRDRTGQSVHVDDYLGAENSAQRQQASQTLSRIHRRMQTATAAGDLDGWRDLFEGN
jgi:hypothetical protein